jgi:hypothetical protein
MASDSPSNTGSLAPFTERTPERRKRKRLAVRWRLRIWLSPQECLFTYTVNISTDGFYCLSPQAVTPGKMLTAILEIPPPDTTQEHGALLLRCEISVLRVETLIGSSGCGVAGKILNYSVVRTPENDFENQDFFPF